MTASPFRHRLRVYWEDTDAGGVVFYANYLKFFERARTEWLRRTGHSQEQLRTVRGVMFVVSATEVRYLAPARLDDELEVSVEPRSLGRVGMALAQQAVRLATPETPATVVAEGLIRIACVDAGTFRPCRIPTDLLEAVSALSPAAASA
jgi:acyl-CoA thioester hydrolase